MKDTTTVVLTAVAGVPLIAAGDDLGAILIERIRACGLAPRDRDVFVVAQKIVSKAEGRRVGLDEVVPTPRALEIAEVVGKDARLVEVILRESREVVRYRRGVLVVEHRLGFVMANAGVDQSNIEHPEGRECALLLPQDPDRSCEALRAQINRAFGADVGVVMNDSFGRPWRNGVTGVAIGAAGLPALVDLVGEPDLFGRAMRVTQVAMGDEIAAAASLLMGQGAEGLPLVHLRGLNWDAASTGANALLRPRHEDMFR